MEIQGKKKQEKGRVDNTKNAEKETHDQRNMTKEEGTHVKRYLDRRVYHLTMQLKIRKC